MQAKWGVGRRWSASHLCDGCEGGGLLSATLGGRGEEGASSLPPEGALLPVATGGIKECLDLGGHHAEARGHAKDDAIILSQLCDSGFLRGIRSRSWGVHLLQHLSRQGLRDL